MELHVFDLDHTLLKENSSFRFGFYLYRRNYFSFWTLVACLSDYAKHKWLGLSIHELHERSFRRLFKGRSADELQQLATQFIEISIDEMIDPCVVQRLEAGRRQGAHLVILSSSPDFLVGTVAKILRVDHWKATTYQQDEQGNLYVIEKVMEGEEKAHYLRLLTEQMGTPRSAITVYSDSYHDLPILKMAGKAICVKPDSYLKEICTRKGWEVML